MPAKRTPPAKKKQSSTPRVVRPTPRNTASGPPPPLGDAVEVSGIYGRVMYSENDPYAEVREIFQHYDRDANGIIESREFSRICEALGMELEEHELKMALLDVDRDHDGRISWDEFLGWWRAFRG